MSDIDLQDPSQLYDDERLRNPNVAEGDDVTPNPDHTDGESDHDSDVLSDLDENEFASYDESKLGADAEASIPIDEDTLKNLGKHKRKLAPGEQKLTKQKRKYREKRRRGGSDVEDQDMQQAPVVELTEEEKRRRAIEKQMDDAIKGPKKPKRRKNVHDLEQIDDEKVENLRMAMEDSAARDAEAIADNQPATFKLAMLKDVETLLSRQSLLNVALDGRILVGIRRWLEPLPNKSLPAYSVQKLMFQILSRLNPDVENLRESGIGKIVMFYTKDSRPEAHIKREAEKLVRDWARPILGQSDDYRERKINDEARSRSAARYDENGPLAAPIRTKRARVPLPSQQSYTVAPQSTAVSGLKQYARPIGASGDDFIRRMKMKNSKGKVRAV